MISKQTWYKCKGSVKGGPSSLTGPPGGVSDALTPEKEEIATIEAAEQRQVFDPSRKIFDNSKRRVTDLKSNTRVHLPKPLQHQKEAHMLVRKDSYTKVFKEYMEENCDSKGRQQENLSKAQRWGLK